MEINFRFIMNVIKMFFRGKGKAIVEWFWVANDGLITFLIVCALVVCGYLLFWILFGIGHYFVLMVSIFGIVLSYESIWNYFLIGFLYTAGLIIGTYTIVGLVIVIKWVKRNLIVAIREAIKLEKNS